ncbi:ZPR1 zinc-finger domain-containing protein [Crepidotus variabilis]|uniref:ZPR1 zinc-finger domain-containing protein n=1 Tax=Crepidotus variabilis TaxID=179855 RepID=A0A9P6JJ28_9AGAR|nr:ZPR1 zinc-finger domain-containing protein [Crepidotus variabilis]
MAAQTNLFPNIGEIAEQTDQLETNADGVTSHDSADEDKVVQQIESLCMKCEEQGVTKLMLTSIPYFKEVIVMSFRCEHCGFSNNEIQSAGSIRAEGTVYTAKILERSDLNRQIVRSESCEIAIPELELTLPPTSRGQLTTLEGLIRDVVTDLSLDQPLRKIQQPEGYEKIQTIIDKIKDILADNGEEEAEFDGKPTVVKRAFEKDAPMKPFTVRLDDPSGNSFIEFIGSMADPKWNMRSYHRTLEQNVALGLIAADDEAVKNATMKEVAGQNDPISEDEIFVFPGICSSCGHAIQTRMKRVNVPYFKDILIMSTNCEFCGYRDNEVKSGSAISAKGKKITLKCEDRDDLSRDILKSETAGLSIPEIELVLTHGTLGGRFTTVEGILEQIYEELSEKSFLLGDASDKEDAAKMEKFFSGLKAVKNADRPFTIILDDPLANSYIQNLYAPDPDPNMVIELYDRSFEQNEDLGLNDIKVEGYEEGMKQKDEGSGS